MTNIIEFKKANKAIVCKIGKISVEFKNCLSVQEYTDAVNEIVSSCFTNDKYTPEFRTLAERYVTLAYFTDIDVSEVNLEELFEITQADWYEKVVDVVSTIPVYNEINQAVDDIIKFRLSDICQLASAVEIASNSNIDSTVDKVNEMLDKANEFNPKKFVDAAVEKVAIENGKS